MMKSAQVLARMEEKEFVTPDHIQNIAVAVIAHRIVLDSQASFSRTTAQAVMEESLRKVPAPA